MPVVPDPVAGEPWCASWLPAMTDAFATTSERETDAAYGRGGDGSGDAEANGRGQAEHQEGTDRGEAATDDRAPSRRGSEGHGPAGRSRSGTGRQTRPWAGRPHAAAALRRGQDAEHPRSFEDGQVGPGRGIADEQVRPTERPEPSSFEGSSFVPRARGV